MSRLPKRERDARARERCASVGLRGLRRSACRASSRAASSSASALARALVLEPTVLLFDEPLSNLDAKLRRRVREEIRELQQGLGLTVLTSRTTRTRRWRSPTGSS